MKYGVLSFVVAMSLSVSAVASDTVYSWRGEKSFVWRDVTNTAACAVLVSPSSSCPFAKVGLAMPVLGDGGILYRDRIVYGVSTLVQPGDFVRLVAELEIPRCGDVPGVFEIESSLGKEEWNLVVSERQFPEGRNRRVFLDLWQHPWAVARYFQVEPFSPAHYERMRPLWEQLADAGQKVITTTIMSDTTYSPWFDHWSAGGTYLVYPNGPSVRFLALRNGLNLSEKIGILRAEGRIDSNLAAILEEFEYKGPKKYPSPPAISDLLDRTERAVRRLSEDVSLALTEKPVKLH